MGDPAQKTPLGMRLRLSAQKIASRFRGISLERLAGPLLLVATLLLVFATAYLAKVTYDLSAVAGDQLIFFEQSEDQSPQLGVVAQQPVPVIHLRDVADHGQLVSMWCFAGDAISADIAKTSPTSAGRQLSILKDEDEAVPTSDCSSSNPSLKALNSTPKFVYVQIAHWSQLLSDVLKRGYSPRADEAKVFIYDPTIPGRYAALTSARDQDGALSKAERIGSILEPMLLSSLQQVNPTLAAAPRQNVRPVNQSGSATAGLAVRPVIAIGP